MIFGLIGLNTVEFGLAISLVVVGEDTWSNMSFE